MSIVIIGSSNIVKFHIESLTFNKVKILALASTKLNSNNSRNLCNKYNISRYESWSEMINSDIKFNSILIVSKIELTSQIIKQCLKTKKMLFVEKPISYNSKDIKNFINYKNIFVLYNRRFYKTVNEIKRFISSKNNLYIDIKIPEKNTFKFIKNGSHIIDILNFTLNNKLRFFKIINRTINNNFIDIFLGDKKNNFIHILIYFNAPQNYSLEFHYKHVILQLKPIEKLNIYKEMKIISETEKNKIKSYIPDVSATFTDYNNLNFKPGFNDQAKAIKKLINSNVKSKKLCTIKEAFDNIKFIEKLLN